MRAGKIALCYISGTDTIILLESRSIKTSALLMTKCSKKFKFAEAKHFCLAAEFFNLPGLKRSF